jgi:hypothetical protein
MTALQPETNAASKFETANGLTIERLDETRIRVKLGAGAMGVQFVGNSGDFISDITYEAFAAILAFRANEAAPIDERAAFEATFRVPMGVKWDGDKYTVGDSFLNSYVCDRFVGRWDAWQARAALASQGASK